LNDQPLDRLPKALLIQAVLWYMLNSPIDMDAARSHLIFDGDAAFKLKAASAVFRFMGRLSDSGLRRLRMPVQQLKSVRVFGLTMSERNHGE